MKPTNRKNGRAALKVRRLPVTLTSDMRRVITRFFDLGEIKEDNQNVSNCKSKHTKIWF